MSSSTRLRIALHGSLVGVAVSLATASAATAQAAPASKIFVEAGLGYGYQMSNSAFLEVDRGTLLRGPRSGGPSLDLAGGYAFLPNLMVFGDLQWAHASSINGLNQDGDTQQYKFSYTSLSAGLRATVPAGPGEVYAEMSLGLSLPFETERDQQLAGGGSRTTIIGYNTGFGARREMGYHVRLNAKMYLAAGLRLQAFTTDNVGKQRVRTDQPGGNVDTQVYSTDPNANNTSPAEALSIQDVRVRLGFGYRF